MVCHLQSVSATCCDIELSVRAGPLPAALDSLSLSVSAFHGRGIQPSSGVREDMLWLAGLESVVGLMVEGLFIAALTRRVTGS